jgi:hypothetical protein
VKAQVVLGFKCGLQPFGLIMSEFGDLTKNWVARQDGIQEI